MVFSLFVASALNRLKWWMRGGGRSFNQSVIRCSPLIRGNQDWCHGRYSQAFVTGGCACVCVWRRQPIYACEWCRVPAFVRGWWRIWICLFFSLSLSCGGSFVWLNCVSTYVCVYESVLKLSRQTVTICCLEIHADITHQAIEMLTSAFGSVGAALPMLNMCANTRVFAPLIFISFFIYKHSQGDYLFKRLSRLYFGSYLLNRPLSWLTFWHVTAGKAQV